jgi:hypothetical protein
LRRLAKSCAKKWATRPSAINSRNAQGIFVCVIDVKKNERIRTQTTPDRERDGWMLGGGRGPMGERVAHLVIIQFGIGVEGLDDKFRVLVRPMIRQE